MVQNYHWKVTDITQKGKNVNLANIIKIRNRSLKPDGATGVEDIEPKMSKWKSDIRYLTEVGDSAGISEPQRMSILVGMMPDVGVPGGISDHLVKKYEELDSYEALEAEVLNLVARMTEERAKKKPIGAFGCQHSHEEDDKGEWSYG